MLNKYLAREREREKKTRKKNKGPQSDLSFLLNFIVYVKISEFIWKVKYSAS